MSSQDEVTRDRTGFHIRQPFPDLGVFRQVADKFVFGHHQFTFLGYETSEAARDEQALLQENKQLRLELASLKAPGRIERMAQNELGLVAPQKEQLIIVR